MESVAAIFRWPIYCKPFLAKAGHLKPLRRARAERLVCFNRQEKLNGATTREPWDIGGFSLAAKWQQLLTKASLANETSKPFPCSVFHSHSTPRYESAPQSRFRKVFCEKKRTTCRRWLGL